jgi:Methylamine utilisation protein MauE
VITALVGGAALLLLAAGALKVADPTRTAGALAAQGLAVAPVAVRVAALLEAALGAAVVVVGGHVLPALMAASYALFACFVAVALRSGTPVGTCGCFAREDTLPSPVHVVVDAGLAIAAVAGAAVGVQPLVEASPEALVGAGAVAGVAYLALTRW